MPHPYCTQDDVEDAADGLHNLIRVSTRDGEDGTAVNVARVDKAINEAQTEVDSYVAKRYAVPLGTVPDTVRFVTSRVAFFRMLGRHVSPGDIERYDRDVKWLEGVSEGKIALGVTNPPPKSSPYVVDRETEHRSTTNLDSARKDLRGIW